MKEDIDIAVKTWAKRVGKRDVVMPKYLATTLKNDFKKIGLIVDVCVENFIEIDDYTYKSDMFAVSGAYVPDIPTHDFEMRILFPMDTIEKGLEMSTDWLNIFALEIAQVAIHENKHKEQAEARDYKLVSTLYRHADTRNEAYLGDTDEIDAYAIAIAYQLEEQVGAVAALDLLRCSKNITYRHSMDLNEYLKVFEVNHKIIKRLFKKIATHLING